MNALAIDDYDIAVVGGGASGLMAALCAARARPEWKIVILERMGRVGKKLMATGNGRCNLTNMRAQISDYHGEQPAFIERTMQRFPPRVVLDFFREIGLCARVEEDGRAYPTSDQASSVLDVLRFALAEAGVREVCDCEIQRITLESGRFFLCPAGAKPMKARRAIVACGGLTAPNLGGCAVGAQLLAGLGHTLTARLPALVQLKTDPGLIRALKGIKYTGGISILLDERPARREVGEVLFTDYGLSGPPVLQLSRIASAAQSRPSKTSVCLSLEILGMPREAVEAHLRRRRAAFPTRMMEHYLTGLVNKRIGQTLVKALGDVPLTAPVGTLTNQQIARLSALLVDWRLPVLGTLGFAQAQVTAGGVRTREVDPETMASLRVPGLYITGEVLDIDGDCGGFNLQWAWASGMAAGLAATKDGGGNR